MTAVLPQCARLCFRQLQPSSRKLFGHTIFVFHLGLRFSVCPVHASSAFRLAIIQSNLPSKCTTTKDVMGDFVAMRAVYGEVEVMRWYTNGMPRAARLKGSRRDSVDIACAQLVPSS